jgi:hypothetical protein
MKFRKFRLMNSADASGGAAPSTPSLLSDGAPTTPAVDQAAPAGDAPAVQADASQQSPTDLAPAKPDEAAAPVNVVPEKYDFKTPDGAPLEGEFVGEFSAIAKDLKLSQEQADKVAELGAKMAKGFSVQQEQALETASAEWAAAVTADKDIGGDKLAENLAIAKKALADLGTPQLTELLEKSKLGNHPEVIRLLVNAGKAISQDSNLVTGGRMTVIESAAQRMYPNMKP